MKQDAINTLISEILKIPGKKIVTLIFGNDCFKIDIDEKGTFGYHPDHQIVFQIKLARALHEGGGMTIREFLPLRVKTKMSNGKEMWIPEKNLYGVTMAGGKWMGFEAEDVQIAHQTDAMTGKSIPRENGVHYKGFPLSTIGPE